ncbi:flagellar brake protein [Vibrio sp. JC009]|uniref:flagellar brake protein n=1 Tax=Vibrio sp. JC009 TaxID=2912314 RepID=UPI0023B1E126|nr:flagellar brake protein [Vibrio sp. JC009]WED24800.1 flagellar brake protein [Vibrio sp. JC009]
MRANTAVGERPKIKPISTPKANESTINSTDAIDMINHGSELTINITTPVGIKYMGKARFIGSHSDNLFLIEPPEISGEDYDYFFQEGFWINIKAISQRGEGAIVQFRSQIEHISHDPMKMVMVKIPGMVKIHQLRKEPRYDVNLEARAVVGSRKIECEIRDLSKGGCRFVTSSLANSFHVGDDISLEIITNNKSKVQLLPLQGHICNLQSSLHYAKYGIQFDDIGSANVKTLLSYLKFDGTKLALKV